MDLETDRVIQSLHIFSSSKIDVCFSSAATLCGNEELNPITMVNVLSDVMKGLTYNVNIAQGVKHYRTVYVL